MKTIDADSPNISLLDINILIALIDPGHEFHDSAHVSMPGYPFPALLWTASAGY
jgi:hypothetical protein